MIFKKKCVTVTALILCVCFMAVLSIPHQQYILTSARVDGSPQVILDAGHGGFDGGAVASDGTVEKDINLNITLVIASLLKQSGFDVILTREKDVSTDDVETDKIATRKKSDLKNRLKLMEDYKDAGAGKPYLIFALTDETFSLVCSPKLPDHVNRKDYYFFVSDSNNKLYFTKTIDEHERMITKLQNEGLWLEW